MLSTSQYDDSVLNLDGFEVVPETPASAKGGLGISINMEDFEDACPCPQSYCTRVTKDVYEEQAEDQTGKSLEELVNFLTNDKSVFMTLMQKRKLEEMEKASMMSFLKSKLLRRLQGEKFHKGLVSKEECEERIQEVVEGMMKAYNYAKENKGKKYYTRQAAKQKARELHNNENTPLKSDINGSLKKGLLKKKGSTTTGLSAPAPPPCPPPVMSPFKLRDSTNIMCSTPCLNRPPIKRPVERTGSVASLHDELLSSNPLKRLRATKKPRSPGGTPVRNKKRQRTSLESLRWETPARLDNSSSEPLASMLMRIMEQKFKNVRSPSPATPGNSLQSSPQSGFTP